jgi:16S rRNA (adenine1518-N6/adenine1519-N6)-dimethyltransferase
MPHQPRKRFGQHFLRDDAVIQQIIYSIGPAQSDVVVEIGPGEGVLTTPLAMRAGHLHAVELDRDLVAALQRRFAGRENVTIHAADALRFDFATLGNNLRLVGNLPYNISTPLLFHLVDQRSAIRDMHFMLQKEVVDRMAAAPGNKTYGRLTIMLGCYMTVEHLFDVPPDAFDPPPKVMSAVVRLMPRIDRENSIADPVLLGRIVAAAFSQRRKTLRNALRTVVTSEAFAAVGIDPGERPEQIAVGDWIALANFLASNPG